MSKRDYLKHLGFATAQAMEASKTEPPMTLPQETKSKIIAEARQYASDKIPNDDYVDNALCSYADGATEYAIRLHQAEQEADRLKGELDVAIRANENLTSRMVSWQQQLHGVQKDRDTARAILEKIISRHEGGLLPDRLLYTEIKTFLDGTK